MLKLYIVIHRYSPEIIGLSSFFYVQPFMANQVTIHIKKIINTILHPLISLNLTCLGFYLHILRGV